VTRTALVVIDAQRSFCDPDGSMARQGRPIDTMAEAARRCDRLASDARAAGARVVWTRMVFAPDYSDGGELIRTIRPNLARIGALRRGSGDELLSSLVHPDPADAIVDKPRYSALVGTGLEEMLRREAIGRVFLCGVTTSMCVESTARDIGQRDFETYVVADCCADFDSDRHRASLAAIEFGFARIVTAPQVLAIMNGMDDGSGSTG
jgi:nicotinamidase-related amidase